MKQIAVFIGSLRRESVNRATFNTYQTLAKEVFQCHEIDIASLPLYNPDLTTRPEGLDASAEVISQADGILFFSPEYNYSVPGALKNAIDWLSRCDPNPFNNKPTAIIGASPGQVGTARMQYHLRQIAVFQNMHILNKPEVMIGSAMQKFTNGALTDESTIEFLAKHVTAFEAFMHHE